MSINGLTFLLLVVVVATVALVVRHLRAQPPSDEQLREWLSFITKSNGKPSFARLNVAEYDAIKLLFHPGLKAEFEEKLTRLENEFSTRAIETALVIRRQAKGLPMSAADDLILIREGLRKQSSGQPNEGVMEFTPGRFTKDEPTTEDRSENEI
jgi:hypothetical protein